MITALLLRAPGITTAGGQNAPGGGPGGPRRSFPGLLWLLACLGLVACLLGALGGCGIFMMPADEITLNRGAATAVWGEMRTQMALSFERRDVECRLRNHLIGRLENILGSGKLARADELEVAAIVRQLRDDQTCASLPRARDQWATIDNSALETLSDPEAHVNWQNVRKAIEILGKLAGAAL